MKVSVNDDGSVLIHAGSREAACLGGREQFGNTASLQAKLVDQIADAWYDAGCPSKPEGEEVAS